MFYDENPQSKLRFGDIVGGFLLTHCHGYEPSFSGKPDKYHIEVGRPQFAAVLTPCCTIEQRYGKRLILSPLLQINPIYYFGNSYFRTDLTRINRKMTIQEAIGPEKWATMSADEQAERLAPSPGKRYTLLHIFCYEKHDLLPEYQIKYMRKTANTNYQVIDFRSMYRVHIDLSHVQPSIIKRLQLSVDARKELRDKLAYYFGRPPEEDDDI